MWNIILKVSSEILNLTIFTNSFSKEKNITIFYLPDITEVIFSSQKNYNEENPEYYV